MRDSYKTFPLLQPYHSCIEFLLMLLHIKSIQMANQGVAFIVNEIQEMHFFFVTKVRGDCDCSSKTTFLVFFFFCQQIIFKLQGNNASIPATMQLCSVFGFISHQEHFRSRAFTYLAKMIWCK